LHELESRDNYLGQIRTPKLPGTLDGLIDRSVFNRRCRQLAAHIERYRQRLLTDLAPAEDLYFVDSMPLEVCKPGRAKRLRICQETEQNRPDYGYCAVHHAHYIGYKLHAACTSAGVIKTFDISEASTHGIRYLNDLKTQLHHCVLVGDKGILEPPVSIRPVRCRLDQA
jgi:hypothetical protein